MRCPAFPVDDMEELKQLEPTLPQHRENPKPPIPEKTPIEVDPASIPLVDSSHTYKSALKDLNAVINGEPPSPPLSSYCDMMGFTKVERPPSAQSHENGSHGKGQGPRQALPKGLVATRFANNPPPHQPKSPAMSVSSVSFVDSDDLIDFGTDVSPSTKETSQGSSPKPRHVERDTTFAGDSVQHAYKDVGELQRKLKASIARAEIAEEKADRMEKRIEEIKNVKSPALTEAERDMDALTSSCNELKTENSALKEQLRDAQSHIFSLQPYRKELTPEEVGRQYDDLVEGITDWVTKFMAPLLENHAKGVDEVLTNARKKPTDTLKLKQAIHMYADLVHGAGFPETDEDIIIAVIMRFLNDHIFQKVLYGCCGGYVEALSFTEMAMRNHVEPKRDLFAIRTWTAEAYNAIISSREFRGVREKRMKELTIELASTFRILCRKERAVKFFHGFEENCIKPAMQLYEKIQVSTHHFYFDINPYIMWGQDGEFQTSTDFFDSLLDLDCKNILQNRKAFNLAKMDPPPSKKELYHRLLNVCTVAPAVYMRQIGRKDALREPQVVRRQQMLVAWGPQERKEAFVKEGEQTLLAHLYSAKNERERAEAGGWTPFRWGG